MWDVRTFWIINSFSSVRVIFGIFFFINFQFHVYLQISSEVSPLKFINFIKRMHYTIFIKTRFTFADPFSASWSYISLISSDYYNYRSVYGARWSLRGRVSDRWKRSRNIQRAWCKRDKSKFEVHEGRIDSRDWQRANFRRQWKLAFREGPGLASRRRRNDRCDKCNYLRSIKSDAAAAAASSGYEPIG